MTGLVLLILFTTSGLLQAIGPKNPSIIGADVQLLTLLRVITIPLILLLLVSRLVYVFKNGFPISADTTLRRITIIAAIATLVVSAFASPFIFFFDLHKMMLGSAAIIASAVIRGLWLGVGFLELVAANSTFDRDTAAQIESTRFDWIFKVFLVLLILLTLSFWFFGSASHF